MASVVAGGLFNAIAFAGAGFLFSSFNKDDYSEETERHDLALEKLSRAKEVYFENEQNRKDKEDRLREELNNAKYDMMDTSKAFNELQQILQEEEKVPELADFYQPSDEMKKYQMISVGIVGCGSGWLLYKLI